MSRPLPPPPNRLEANSREWKDWFNVLYQLPRLTDAQHASVVSMKTVLSKAGAPTTTEIPAGKWEVYKDTTAGTVRLWTNDGGVMKSVQLI